VNSTGHKKKNRANLRLEQAVFHGFRNIQIANLDAAVLRQEAIGRFQVAMYDVLRV